jgi:tetratricopeptide (TPR) repeat protein
MILRACVAVMLFHAGAAWAADSSAEIVSVEGKGEFREAQQGAWRPAGVKQPLFPTNFVRTLDLSRMAILFVDRTQVQLSQNSVLQIKEVATAAGGRTVLNLNKGKSWTQSKTTPAGLIMETPSALAAIRGTDWEMAVDDDGRATLSVFSGEVEFFNDQGTVRVGASEQARAEKGKAPVKLALQVSRERIQWVSSFSIDPSRHPRETLAEAYERLRRAATRSAADELLLADIEIYRGEVPAARRLLKEAGARFPGDERFDVALARTAALEDDAAAARVHASQALAKRPDSVDALIVLGDIERRDGHAREAMAAYGRAAAVAAKDPRGWHGLGVVESERENVRRARSHLETALSLDRESADSLGELGTLEGVAGNHARGREALERALALHPDNYVALTGLGALELRAGHIDAALDALLRATLIEPRYARAHLYLAAAYYQQEREAAAMEELRRAAELDPKDPLPHLLAGIIHLDRLEPGAAVEEARQALERMPFLKSVNQIADNQRGIANVGAPLAFMGLEAWARSAAHDSYLPFWGASHLFLADRYPGAFDRRAELMQGFITNPLVFGASNRFQSLLPEPGHHATATVRYNTTDDVRVFEPVVAFNGYDAQRIPFAYFVEAIDTHIDPRNADLKLHGPTYTVALGAKPTHELGFFAYLNHLSLDADLGRRNVTGQFDAVSASASRADVGMRYAPSSISSVWLKAGAGRQSGTSDEVTTVLLPQQSLLSTLQFQTRTRTRDVSLRHTTLASDALEITWGAEVATQRSPRRLERDVSLHFVDFPVAKEALEQTDKDRSQTVYGLVRVGPPKLQLEAGVAASRYRIDRDITLLQTRGAIHVDESLQRRKTDPLVGVVWRPNSAMRLRAACRRWLRPIGLDTLAPVAVAGMPLDDQLVFAGGTLEQCRAQAEWTWTDRTFLSAHVERSRVHNLVSPLDGVLNTGADVTNLDRLRNRAQTPPPKPDLLEDTPIYGEGTARRTHVALEQRVGRNLGLRWHYIYTDSENTAPALAGLRIPYLARHQANIGMTWAPGWRSYLTVVGVYRTRRFADEANTVLLPSGWDAQVTLFKESYDKRWAVEIFGANLLKKEASDVFGVAVSYRF